MPQAQQATIDPAKVLNFVQVTSAFGKRALDEIAQNRKGQEKAASLRPDLLQTLLDTGTIEPHQKEAAAAALGDHAQTLSLLKNAVIKLAEFKGKTKQAGDSRLGTAEDAVPQAGQSKRAYDSLTDPFVGARSSVKKASDRALFEGLGIPQE